MQLELFFTAYDFYGTMDNTKFPKADENHDGTPFNNKGYLYHSDCNSSDWIALH